MAYEIPGFSFPLPSGADYSTAATPSKFRFVRVNSVGKAVLVAGGTPALVAGTVGVCQISPRLNEAMTIVHSGVSFVVAGGAIAVGAAVTSDATGRAVAAAVGNTVLGVALETASGVGIQIAVLLQPAVNVA